jgi:hypothetical protein
MTVNWDRLPVFIHEGVTDFPFSNNSEAQEFMELLVTRSLFLMVDRPDNVSSMEAYLELVKEQWVSELMETTFIQ